MTVFDGSPRSGGASLRRPHLPALLLLVLVGSSLWTFLQRRAHSAGGPFAAREINLQPLNQPPPGRVAALPLSSHKVRRWQLVILLATCRAALAPVHGTRAWWRAGAGYCEHPCI